LQLNAKAIHSGTEVRAAQKLWTVSAANGIDPDQITITPCETAVNPSPSRNGDAPQAVSTR
jgi:hypothetical protein